VSSYNLGPKLFLSHLVVALTGTVAFVVVFLAAPLVAPASLVDLGGKSVAGRALLAHVLPAAAAATVSAIAASLFVARRISGPLRRIVQATRRLSSGRYEERVPVSEDDEIGELAKSFNAMAAALEDGEARRRRFVADVSHELRTPLSTLGGYVDGLVDGVVEPGEGAWAPMHAETRRMMRLVDDLQQLARAETGHLTLHAAPFPPRKVATLAVEGVRPLFVEKGVELRGPDEADRPEEPLRSLPRAIGDTQRVAQVLTNLLSNALRHTPSGGHVAVRVGGRDGRIFVSVSDTGLGISHEHLGRLFDRFYRVEAARSRDDGGSGLGLAISRALVEAMGGSIRADSTGPGTGATFTFTLLAEGRTEWKSPDGIPKPRFLSEP